MYGYCTQMSWNEIFVFVVRRLYAKPKNIDTFYSANTEIYLIYNEWQMFYLMLFTCVTEIIFISPILPYTIPLVYCVSKSESANIRWSYFAHIMNISL